MSISRRLGGLIGGGGVFTLGPSLSLLRSRRRLGLELRLGLRVWSSLGILLHLAWVLVVRLVGVLDVGLLLFFPRTGFLILVVVVLLVLLMLVLSEEKQMFLLLVERGFRGIAPAQTRFGSVGRALFFISIRLPRLIMLRVIEVGRFFAGDTAIVGGRVCESVQVGESDRSASLSLLLFSGVRRLRTRFIARRSSEFIRILDGTFGDTGEEGLFGGEFLRILFFSCGLWGTWVDSGAWGG